MLSLFLWIFQSRTVQSDSSFDPSVNLVMDDIAIDNPANPTLVRVSIKASKTDPSRKGVSIFLGRTYNDICPIAALLAYLAAQGQQGFGSSAKKEGTV